MAASKTWTTEQKQAIRQAFSLSEESPSGLVWASDRRSGNGRLNHKAGDVAGRIWKLRGLSYWRVGLAKREYYVHRIVYFLHYNVDPNQNDCTVDHINRDGLNNSQSNLRLATRAMQQQNRRWNL